MTVTGTVTLVVGKGVEKNTSGKDTGGGFVMGKGEDRTDLLEVETRRDEG